MSESSDVVLNILSSVCSQSDYRMCGQVGIFLQVRLTIFHPPSQSADVGAGHLLDLSGYISFNLFPAIRGALSTDAPWSLLFSTYGT